MNKKKQYSHACTIYEPIQHWLYREHIQTENERNIVLYPPIYEIGDFVPSDKSKKRFLILVQPFLRSDIAKIVFSVQYYALIMSIISFKGKDLWTFSDGNNQIFSLFTFVPVIS